MGFLGKLLGLAEGAEALYESQLRSGLKDSRLKPQPPHVNHYNQNSSYIWIALLSRVNAEYRHLTGKSTVQNSAHHQARETLFAPQIAPPVGKQIVQLQVFTPAPSFAVADITSR